MSDDDIDPDWCLPPNPLKPLPQVARLTDDRDAIRALLVKACVEIADYRTNLSGPGFEDDIIRGIYTVFSVRLRQVGATFEEDATK